MNLLSPLTPASRMISPLSNGVFFDSAFNQNEPQDILREIRRINRLHVISGTALWFQKWNMVYLSENWSEIFRIPIEEIFLLEDYLVLIENEQDRNRIWAGRELLISQEPGSEWADEFTLRNQRVQSFAVVAEGCVFGMDRLAR